MSDGPCSSQVQLLAMSSKIFSPFGTKPNYTDMQQVSFDNAGEKAIGGSVAYDFGYASGPFRT